MIINKLSDIGKNNLNQVVEAIVLITEIKLKLTKTEKKYADLTLQDASRKVEAKFWDIEENESFLLSLKANEAIRVKAVVGEYQGNIQLAIKEMERAKEGEVNIRSLIPTSEWDLESMKKGLQFFYDKVQSPHLRQLLDIMIFSGEHYERFSTYPAASKVHHNFYYGLLQHVLEVLKYAYTVATTKKLTDRQIDRLIVMGFLHDWAKIFEYKPLPESGFTEEGAMLGHIFMGAHKTLNVIKEIPDFDEEDKLIILNGILGHHGKLEFGSPVLPKTVEAQILHHADKMSGDVESIQSFMNEDGNKEESFTSKLWNMGTEYYRRG